MDLSLWTGENWFLLRKVTTAVCVREREAETTGAFVEQHAKSMLTLLTSWIAEIYSLNPLRFMFKSSDLNHLQPSVSVL